MNDRKLKDGELPYSLKPGDVLFVHDGPVLVAVRPLVGQNLGVKGSQIRLEHEGRCLGLSVYNYQSDQPLPLSLEKVKLINPMRFIRGGFMLQVGDRQHYPEPASFHQHVLAGTISEEIKDGKARTVTWRTGHDTMAVRYNMDTDRLLSRTLNGKPAACPPLDCPDAHMDYTGEVTVHGATLRGEQGLPLILASPGESGPFVATKPTDKVGPLALSTPQLSWKTAAFGCGQVRLYAGQTPRLEIDQLRSAASFFVRGDGLTTVINGVNVTDRLRAAPGMPGWKELPCPPVAKERD